MIVFEVGKPESHGSGTVSTSVVSRRRSSDKIERVAEGGRNQDTGLAANGKEESPSVSKERPLSDALSSEL